eukprot:1561957-Pyramimonas_sp.AAC.1
MVGAVPDDGEDDMIEIMSWRVTLSEYTNTSRTKTKYVDARGGCESDEDDYAKLGEDLWYLLKDSLEGATSRGKLKNLRG